MSFLWSLKLVRHNTIINKLLNRQELFYTKKNVYIFDNRVL